jgi:hypothetical protein
MPDRKVGDALQLLQRVAAQGEGTLQKAEAAQGLHNDLRRGPDNVEHAWEGERDGGTAEVPKQKKQYCACVSPYDCMEQTTDADADACL